jgi:uncharacterized membrane protein
MNWSMSMKRSGWIMSWLFASFMLFASAAPKLLGAQVAVEPMIAIGWPVHFLALIGFIELAGTLLFLHPRTALCGAILLTGVLGGAIASHLRVGSPLLGTTLFGVYLGAIMWSALWLREDKVKMVLPLIQKH